MNDSGSPAIAGAGGRRKPARPVVSRVRPAYEQVAEQLRDLIIRNELRAGDRLPVEGELCEMFGVSRSTIREALRALAARDLVRTVRGTAGGTFVAELDPSTVSAYLETSLGMLSGRTVPIGEILEARELLEVPAARLAAERATEAEVRALYDAQDRERARGERRFREHHSFHSLLVEASGNGLLKIVSDPIYSVLSTKFLVPDLPAQFWRDVDDDHHELCDRVSAGDGPGAAEAMRAHLDRIRAYYAEQS